MAVTIQERGTQSRARKGVLEPSHQVPVEQVPEAEKPRIQSADVAETGGMSYLPIEAGLFDLPLVRAALPVLSEGMVILLLLGRLFWRRTGLLLVSAMSLTFGALAFIDGHLGTPSRPMPRRLLHCRQSPAPNSDTAAPEANERF
jgi:hypothetical protein